jgi:hypothetical protein
MRVSLIDIDSIIPNLALMKISAYHKSKGDVVGFKLPSPDKISMRYWILLVLIMITHVVLDCS